MARATADLLARKAELRELGEGPLPPSIAAFVDDEFAAARVALGEGRLRVGALACAETDALFGRVSE